MKYVKVMGLSVSVAVVLTMVAAVGSASATVLCQNEACSSTYGAGTTVTLTIKGSVLLKAGIENTCTEGVSSGSTENAGGASETVKGGVGSLEFKNCNCGTTVIKNGSIEYHVISGTHDGTLTGKNNEVTTNCGGVSCTYGTAAGGTDIGTLDGSPTPSAPATLTVSSSTPKIGGGFLCASTGTFTGEYTVTSPVPLYIG